VQKKYRLVKKRDYNIVYAHGETVSNRQFVVYFKRNEETEHFRLGLSVSRKIGNAVVRNRMRRLVKEIVRRHKDEIVPHVDMIFIVRIAAVSMDYHQLEKSVLHVLRKAGLLAENGSAQAGKDRL
jgi:ribonuclease P protein component